MRDDYLQAASARISDPYVLINIVSARVRQLARGSRPLVESLEKLAPVDVALREIAEGKITFEYGIAEAEDPGRLPGVRDTQFQHRHSAEEAPPPKKKATQPLVNPPL